MKGFAALAEGLRAGCVPVGYAGYHLPLVPNGLGRLVAPGGQFIPPGSCRTPDRSF
jgi:hypothetical protein